MKVLPFQIPKQKDDALIFQEDLVFSFYDKLHQHEEIQICFIKKGTGTLIVGDTINDFKENDALIIGSNVPHVFRSDSKIDEKSHMITLFFTKDSFGNDFFNLKELNIFNDFFTQAKHGFRTTSNHKKIKKQFLKLKNSSKLDRFIILLKLIKHISKSNFESLSSFIYEKKYTAIEGKRMRDVFEYTMKNYTKGITLDDISEVAALTKNAFCKYFKKRTNKSYFRFLNELKIEHSCKLISSKTDLTLAEIAFKSGFKNISNFNRQFKVVKNMSPSNYRKLKE
ncbi:AraC family transcriptional regulator [Polaribacter sp. ALD11]|uniref:AraC family transcriptional regulator n=1 Tax=Polaribacter sp. ALD11 TaxID=2058137 RepID=UPI000C31499A|nr:AraC family transcriptional regulator [Polaribacter sp. ALD11]AUC84948.1 AraC family transcriptional regulator [Polaribacter sp. ALD11]